ncbi:MAG: DMT family transporter [bacterium]|nr:DMT family transporter [bacterium]
MEKQKIRNGSLLFLTSIIWGISFVAQTVGMDHVGPFTFTGVRCTLGGIVLLPYIAVTNRRKQQTEKAAEDKKKLVLGGILCGIILFLGTSFQQIGLMTTSAGKSGFITALYIVIVPVLGLFLKKKAGIKIWFSVGLSLAGLYLLCMKESLSIQKGDILLLICAFIFSIHILVIDHYTNHVDGVKMSCIQFFVCGLLGITAMFLMETPRAADILAAWKPILYSGALSCGIGYTLQIVGQKGMNPTVASLILSLESVNASIAGWLLLNQRLSSTEITGCVLVFAAIILAQLPNPKSIG